MGTPGYKYFNKYFHMIVNFAPDNLSQDDERHESSSVESASSCDWGRGNSEELDGSHSRDWGYCHESGNKSVGIVPIVWDS